LRHSAAPRKRAVCDLSIFFADKIERLFSCHTAIAMPVIFNSDHPDPAMFKHLYDSTGWGPQDRDAAFYAQALRGSWYCVGAYENDELVGFGRIISDGKLHAFITEMIVHPAFQGLGIGKTMLDRLLTLCHAQGISDIQLFSAFGKSEFYARQGFAERPMLAPGMQYVGPEKSDM